jgi:hypothetical protein
MDERCVQGGREGGKYKVKSKILMNNNQEIKEEKKGGDIDK